jgi:hypothetical protein
VEVLTFHRFEDFPSSRRNKSGSPVSVLGVIVTAGEESWSKSAEEICKLLLLEDGRVEDRQPKWLRDQSYLPPRQ